MVFVRSYREADASAAGKLIADTYTKFNLTHVTPDNLAAYLGPFAYAQSTDEKQLKAIKNAIHADIVLVAEMDSELAGVLRGRTDKLQSLFVSAYYQRQGIGKALVADFEDICLKKDSTKITVQSTLYAVPFYLAMGYKRTTGIRHMTSFEGKHLPYQPMKKQLTNLRKRGGE